jgi:flagellar motor switch protein FliG
MSTKSADRREQEVRPVVWPTEEPEVPASVVRPAVAAGPEPVAPVPKSPELPQGVSENSTHAYIFLHPREAAAVVRTVICRDGGESYEGPLAGMTTRQVVAAVMSGLGVQVGSAVLREIRHTDETEFIARAIAEEPEVTHAVAMAALEMVDQRMVAGDYLEEGGPGYALELLESTHGIHRARHLLRPQEGAGESGFDWLENIGSERLAPFISHEHPQTIALVLSQLQPRTTARILGQLPERLQSDVAYRMATMESVSPAVVAGIEESLAVSLHDAVGRSQDVGGPKVVADALNLTGSSIEKNVLDQIDSQDPEVAETVRIWMFTFADIGRLTDRELQVVLAEVDEKDLVIALKGAEQDLRAKFLGNASEEKRVFYQSEMDHLGPMRRSEVEEVQLRVVHLVRRLEEEGKLTIVRGDADDLIIFD